MSSPAKAQKTCATDECHTPFKEKIINTHPDESSCKDCHQGDLEKHEKEELREKLSLAAKMCGECHDELMDHQYPHSPAVNGECNKCHYPHGNIENMLLRTENAKDFYVAYSEQEYTLCFSCHERDLLMYPETSFSTDFRDGIRNLHYLHVTKGMRGRNCLVCHDAHGSDQPKLMADSIDFGNWEMNMNFIKTETGGGCAPGCHRVRGYDRKIR